MNFRLSKKKVIWSIILGIIIALINYARLVFQGINAVPISYSNVILVGFVSIVVIYAIWSLFQKKGRRK
ncbi:MAG: hypothetical protein Q8N63_02380 [Nanoarchaeota archaeon]|nr:hypothetical protein [Nanoarchaeota archaeon]